MKQEYGANQIQVLEGLEAVRLRPGMYIGSTGPRGLHHLVYEIVDNSIDEALQGYCDRIYVCINEDGSVTTKDDGRGIPVETHPKTGKSTLETVLTYYMPAVNLAVEVTRYLVVFTVLGYLLLMDFQNG